MVPSFLPCRTVKAVRCLCLNVAQPGRQADRQAGRQASVFTVYCLVYLALFYSSQLLPAFSLVKIGRFVDLEFLIRLRNEQVSFDADPVPIAI